MDATDVALAIVLITIGLAMVIAPLLWAMTWNRE